MVTIEKEGGRGDEAMEKGWKIWVSLEYLLNISEV